MAAASTNPPLKSIEETYQMKTHLEHIRLRPDTYVGSVHQHTKPLWVYEDGAMVHRYVTYVPGIYMIFDEILVNVADNKQRDPSMDSLQVDIDVEGCCISVYNNGHGIPVVVDQQEGIYVPELIFANLLTSINYHDNERKTFGSRDGYGAILANIFSREFVIEIADGRRQKKYKQMADQPLMGQWVHPSQPRPIQMSSERYGAGHGKTKKRDRDDGFAAIEEKMMEDPSSITKCIRTIEKLHDLQVDDILVAADIFKTKENREVFLSFSRDDLRLAWIKREIVRSQPYNKN